MNIEQALKLALTAACPSVGARVSAKEIAHGSQLPALTFQRLAPAQQIMAHGGGTGLYNANFQVVVWAATYEAGKATVNEVKTLDGYRGDLSGLACQRLSIQDDQDDTDTMLSAHKVILKLSIMWKG